MLTGILITAIVALVVGGAAGYGIFRYVIKGKYNEMIAAANKEAEVVKEKKLLEVKEKFLNKKSELEKEVQLCNGGETQRHCIVHGHHRQAEIRN